jgi:hypothetical protein
MSLKNADCCQNLPTIPLPYVQENKTKSSMLHKEWVPMLAKKIHPRLQQKIQTKSKNFPSQFFTYQPNNLSFKNILSPKNFSLISHYWNFSLPENRR